METPRPLKRATPPPPPISPDEIRQKFRCHQCGNCCRGSGHVWLDSTDIRRIAAWLALDTNSFLQQYTTTDPAGHPILLDQNDALKSCIFLVNSQCQIHEAKPAQCCAFPFEWRPPDIAEFCQGWRTLLAEREEEFARRPPERILPGPKR